MVVIIERCWLCLEQPAVATIELADGRCYPVCDVCLTEQRQRTPQVSEAEWSAIVESLQEP